MKDKFTFRGTTAFNEGKVVSSTTQVNLRGHRCESTRVEPSLPCTRHLSQPSHDSLTNDRVRVISVWFFWVCRCVRERDSGKNRGSFGNLIIGGGAGTATWTMCFSLLLKCPRCLFTNIPKQTTFFFLDKNIKVFKNRYVIKFEFFH